MMYFSSTPQLVSFEKEDVTSLLSQQFLHNFTQTNGERLYQVVWKQNSWVPESELKRCTELIGKFEDKDVTTEKDVSVLASGMSNLQLTPQKEVKEEKVCSPKQKDNNKDKTKEERKQGKICVHSRSIEK